MVQFIEILNKKKRFHPYFENRSLPSKFDMIILRNFKGYIISFNQRLPMFLNLSSAIKCYFILFCKFWKHMRMKILIETKEMILK
jgi:hypothetical protein